MSKLEFYKPHIKVKIFSDIDSPDLVEFYPPIEINKYPDDLEVNCTVERNCLQGNFALTLLLDVVNLSTVIKWQLLNNKYRYIVIYAGYLGTNYYDAEDKDDYIQSKLKIIFKGWIVWTGTIVEARKKVTTRFLAIQNYTEVLTAYTEALSIRFDAGYNLYQLIKDIIQISNNPNVKLNLSEEDLNQVLDFDATYSKYKYRSLEDILNIYGITITQGFDLTEGAISESTYIEMNSRNNPPSEIEGTRNVVTVTEDTGLINIPTLQTTGNYPAVKFKMLFDSRIKTFSYVKLKNADIQLPAVEEVEDVKNYNTGIYLSYGEGAEDGWGYYLVLRIIYSLDSRGGNFTQEIEASPYNVYNQYITKNTSNT